MVRKLFEGGERHGFREFCELTVGGGRSGIEKEDEEENEQEDEEDEEGEK